MQKIVVFNNRHDLTEMKQIISKLQRSYPEITLDKVNIANLTALLLPNDCQSAVLEDDHNVHLIQQNALQNKQDWIEYLNKHKKAIAVDIMTNNQVDLIEYLKNTDFDENEKMMPSADIYADYLLEISDSERMCRDLYHNEQHAFTDEQLPHEFVVTKKSTWDAIHKFRQLLINAFENRVSFPRNAMLQTQIYRMIFPRFRQIFALTSKIARPVLVLPQASVTYQTKDGSLAIDPQLALEVLNQIKTEYTIEHFDDDFVTVDPDQLYDELFAIAAKKNKFLLPVTWDLDCQKRDYTLDLMTTTKHGHRVKNPETYRFDIFVN